jgi:hypothetical protein
MSIEFIFLYFCVSFFTSADGSGCIMAAIHPTGINSRDFLNLALSALMFSTFIPSLLCPSRTVTVRLLRRPAPGDHVDVGLVHYQPSAVGLDRRASLEFGRLSIIDISLV